MFQQAEGRKVEIREHMRDGAGQVTMLHCLTGEQLPAKCRLMAQITLQPGCGIGYHVHTGETEIFSFLQGEAQVDDNGTKRICRAGDVLATPNGCGHAVHNAGEVPVVMTAVIIKD
ncbi:MAG: cupin domain-containing protein [Eubacteriales bacterium]|nr:cupin domain-containing protein [Eubacteriales bacterium]